MKTIVRVSLLLLLLPLYFPFLVSSRAEVQSDAMNKTFDDEVLNNLAGDWTLSRKMHGRNSLSTVHAEWVLNHQFLFIHMKEQSNPSQYEARVYIGYDTANKKYIVHWIDMFGGRVSETLGYGTREGNSIKLEFNYPDGLFHNTLTWHPETKGWTTLLQQKDPNGKWSVFAEEVLSRS
jgi:hypothetical protein